MMFFLFLGVRGGSCNALSLSSTSESISYIVKTKRIYPFGGPDFQQLKRIVDILIFGVSQNRANIEFGDSAGRKPAGIVPR